MYLIQMADLHIGSDTKTVPDEETFIRKSIELIRDRVPEGAEILLCLCGDIIDSRKTGKRDRKKVHERYEKAAQLVTIYKQSLGKHYRVFIRYCIGNHDITHGMEFLAFTKKINNRKVTLEQFKTCYLYKNKKEDSYFIFVNSCKGDQHKIGSINYEKLEKELEKIPLESSKTLVLHHAVMSMYEDDSSSIRNARKLEELVEKYHVTAILHGHIHGSAVSEFGSVQCKLIGTGALFSRNNPNVNSQFNLIRYEQGLITEIFNCGFHADGGNHPWEIRNRLKEDTDNFLKGESFKDVYGQLQRKMSAKDPLSQVVLQISNDYEVFHADLEEYLKDDCLEIGNKSYDYFKLAKMWEAEEVPEELYFNHGSRFHAGGKSGIGFVKEQLCRKPTSNRIVLTTYDMENVIQSLDDSVYLPSLESIQFGRNERKDELIVHMNLRALEANRFLKINICEIDYILRKLRKGKDSVNFSRVKIIISAFRVHKKEKFNCFLKADIDRMPETELNAKVNHGNIGELCKLLGEKKDGMETITNVKGIKTVYKAMKASNKEVGPTGSVYYSMKILEKFKRLLKVYEELDEFHKQSSIPDEEERECEMQINKLLDELIRKLEEME